MPTLSRQTMKLEMAVHSLKDVDRLYCLCGNKSMENAALLTLDDRVETNIMGIAKTMFDDFPGLEAIGSRTAALEFENNMEDAYRNATQMNYHANTITPDMADYHAFRELAPGTPALIIEVGFMNLDRELLTTNADIPARGITDGILCFLNQYKQAKATN